MKIGKKILLTCGSLLVISIVLTGVVVNSLYYNTLVNTSTHYSETLVEQVAINMGTRAQEYEDGILGMIQNWRLFEDNFNKADSDDYSKRRTLSSFVNTRNTTRSPIKDIYILNKTGDLYYFNYASQSFHDANENVKKYIKDYYSEITQRAVWFCINDDENTVYMIRGIFSPSTLSYVGVVTVGVNKSVFQQQFTTLTQNRNGHLIIANVKGEAIFGDTENVPDLNILLSKDISGTSGDKLYSFDGIKYIFKRHDSYDEKWKILYLVSEKELLGQANQMKTAIVLVCAIALIAACICVAGLSRNIANKISPLITHIQSVKYGEWKKVNLPQSKDEIGDITYAYNQMVNDLQNMVNTVTEQRLEAEHAQYKALQAEFKELQAMINPHFIYNVMESINAIAKLEGQDKISFLCTSFGKLMRTAISRHKDLIPLIEELQYMQTYLDIQKFIMGKRLEVYFDYDHSLDNCIVPALILQPIVENAVVHGIEAKTENAVIFISTSNEIKDNEDCLVVHISDNGVGMNQATLKKFLDFSMDENDMQEHYGLSGVFKRIKILYGEPYGLEVNSEFGVGTTITLILPIRKAKEAEDSV